MSFPERIKSLRIRNHYSQVALSELIGVKNNTVWRWENNKAKPDTETIVKIARALNTTASYLLGETNDSTPEIYSLAQKLSNEDIDLLKPITAGISKDMIIVKDENKNMTYTFPNNEEGRKTLDMLINRSQGNSSTVFANSISGDNNN